MSNNYYLGIDGGGTKTAFVVIDDNNNIVFKNTLGPSSLDTVDDNMLLETLSNGLVGFDKKITSIFAGLGGIANENDCQKVISMIKKTPYYDESVKLDVGNDVINALYGSFLGDDGIILIVGTGSACFGKKGDRTVRTGGYCYHEGDFGSAYDLGKKALSYLAKVIDKREKSSQFSDKLMEATHCCDYSSLVTYFVNASRTTIANLAKVVTSCDSSKYAKRIMDDAIDELIIMIKPIYKSLFKNDRKVNLSIIGSLGNSNTYYKTNLYKKIKSNYKNIVIVRGKEDASYGAALKAKDI